MSKFDGYFLRQLLVLCGFFAFVLVGVFWISKAVSLFDRLISSGQTAMVALEFTALTLPTLVRTVMPMAAFCATVYVTNRLNRESEMTVMLATGSSPFRLARPVILFGLVCAAMLATITLYLRPAAMLRLEARQAEVAGDMTAQLLNDGQFMHPVKGVTVYIGKIDRDGTLNDVYLSDRRAPERVVTYTSSKAFLARSGEQIALVMVEGTALQMETGRRTLSTTVFRDFSYDISALAKRDIERRQDIRGMPTLALATAFDGEGLAETYSRGEISEELQERLSWIGVSVAVTLIGFSTLMLGTFSRFGLWPQLIAAFAGLIALEGMRSTATAFVGSHPGLWWVQHAPALGGIALSILFLKLAGRPLRLRRYPDTGSV
ncbi:LPS export ABC transporter permease LptF [Ruegeria pomeroyi]|uniref:Membrane protein, putative n=2 Tax=Ruegeria pomeroyi TaxID=89184 RepID=Q5LLY5_RUEPO|nr:LPS export ABC transporter permease LptF [Ruegeria pomeroyi]AAV97000.1 membrane protein, putative [Ruegeria pomeroyi DSS-3]QWV10528.1 LPS export ABC transporter permease LptF [Ruegeria pomeroyi]